MMRNHFNVRTSHRCSFLLSAQKVPPTQYTQSYGGKLRNFILTPRSYVPASFCSLSPRSQAQRELRHENLFLFSSGLFPLLHHYFCFLRDFCSRSSVLHSARHNISGKKRLRIIHVLEIIETKNFLPFSPSEGKSVHWGATQIVRSAFKHTIKRWKIKISFEPIKCFTYK